MPQKPIHDKSPKQRVPRQARAQEKVELILEAAVRLLERDGIESLTTNALAETAGVSIGTLYQYFKNKDAVLAALAERDVAARSARIWATLQGAPATDPADRIRAVVRAALDAYGGRRGAHRLVMNHAMSRSGPGRLAPLLSKLTELFTGRRIAASGKASPPLSAADAFVLTQAVTGVLRSVIQGGAHVPSREEIETSLTRLILNFAQG